MTDPTLLRRAIESVGIEKPSDYTLVLGEVERLMDERLVEKVARALASCDGSKITGPSRHKATDAFGWDPSHNYRKQYEDANWQKFTTDAHFAIEASGLSALIRAATDLVQEMEEMGYGKTSDRALPGSWDTLVAALNEVKR